MSEEEEIELERLRRLLHLDRCEQLTEVISYLFSKIDIKIEKIIDGRKAIEVSKMQSLFWLINRAYLFTTGRPIVEDIYIPSRFGVSSSTLESLISQTEVKEAQNYFNQKIRVVDDFLVLLQDCDTDYIAELEFEVINQVVVKLAPIDYYQLFERIIATKEFLIADDNNDRLELSNVFHNKEIDPVFFDCEIQLNEGAIDLFYMHQSALNTTLLSLTNSPVNSALVK